MSEYVSVEILAIGNELLRGEILDTNTHWLCQLVTNRGGQVTKVTMLPDIEEEIAAAVHAAIARGTQVIFTSGGLGPTADDLTLAAVAKGAGRPLLLDQQAREMVRERYDTFYAKGIMQEGGLNPFREKMAWIPEGATPLFNPTGTAPGVLLQQGATSIISLPGVPPELKAIINESLVAFMQSTFGSGGASSRVLTVQCNDESILSPALSRVVHDFPQIYIKSLAKPLGEAPELDVLFLMTGGEAEERRALVDQAFASLAQHFSALDLPHWEKQSEVAAQQA